MITHFRSSDSNMTVLSVDDISLRATNCYAIHGAEIGIDYIFGSTVHYSCGEYSVDNGQTFVSIYSNGNTYSDTFLMQFRELLGSLNGWYLNPAHESTEFTSIYYTNGYIDPLNEVIFIADYDGRTRLYNSTGDLIMWSPNNQRNTRLVVGNHDMYQGWTPSSRSYAFTQLRGSGRGFIIG